MSDHEEAAEQGQSANNDSTLHFVVDAGLLLQLGEQLVARRSIALAELIKNAYDADATRVRVTFQNVDPSPETGSSALLILLANSESALQPAW